MAGVHLHPSAVIRPRPSVEANQRSENERFRGLLRLLDCNYPIYYAGNFIGERGDGEGS